LFVLPERRGSGVGAELVQVAQFEFIRMGCANVSLQLSGHNDSARRFYRRAGYAERTGFELLDKNLRAESSGKTFEGRA
jgi:ribosomal protein S18 acetylase RimI-like enzyme